MSHLHRMNPPKTRQKNILFLVIAALMVLGITVGIVAMTHRGKKKIPQTVIKTEVIEDES